MPVALNIALNREHFGFSIAVLAWLFAPKPSREEIAFPLCTLLAFFLNPRCRWVDGHDLILPNVAQNLAAARFPPRGIRALRLEPPVGQIFERAILLSKKTNLRR